MFRISLIICVSLIYCITGKPWNKHADDAIQETAEAIDDKGMLSFKVEVELPQDMDGIQHDIDPHMRIWKSMTVSGQNKQPLKAEEDLDELYHPSVPELLQVQIQNLGPAADIQEELRQEDAKIQYRQEAEEDRDYIDHPAFEKGAAEEPNEDLNVAYNKAREELRSGFRVQLQPEEDMDDIYHKDSLMPVFNQENTKAAAAAAVDLPFQGKYSEPEEDMDDVYHR